MGAIACDKVEMVPARGLLDGLAGLKQHYAAVAILPGLDCGSSDYAGFNGRFTMQDVILARMDRRRFKFSPSNLQAQRFLAQLNRPRSALRHDPFRDQPRFASNYPARAGPRTHRHRRAWRISGQD
jgi:hypothetical protein